MSAHGRRIRWDRIGAAAVVLIVLIFLLGSCVSSCTGSQGGDESSQLSPIVAPSGGSSLAPSGSLVDPSGTSSVADGSAANSAAYTTSSQPPAAVYSGELVQVDSNHPSHLSKDELDLVQVAYAEGKLDCYGVSYPAYTLYNRTALKQFQTMMGAYFTSTKNKEILFNYGYLAQGQENGNAESATGLDMQLHLHKTNGGFDFISNTGAYAWIYNNMHQYGFVLRYPKGKEDLTGCNGSDVAFRYVGVIHATYMKEHSLCLEEYLTMLKEQYAYGTAMLNASAGSLNCTIYYVPASTTGNTDVPVPKNGTYTLSGNNVDGFIVTVTAG